MRLVVSALSLACVLSGCQAPPNTPGAGEGADYTPIIDMNGVDRGSYDRDLSECRQYARAVDVKQASIDGAITGAILGAAVAGALGGNRQSAGQAANYGGLRGTVVAGNQAAAKASVIITNCMVGRGYRALEVTIAAGGPPAAPQAARMAAHPSAGADSNGSNLTTASLPEVAPGVIPSGPIIGLVSPNWQAQAQVARMPEVRRCHQQPAIVLAGTGADASTFSIKCNNGSLLIVRCEQGTCRAMK
jgi:outer membrane lipoprotein SlyB